MSPPPTLRHPAPVQRLPDCIHALCGLSRRAHSTPSARERVRRWQVRSRPPGLSPPGQKTKTKSVFCPKLVQISLKAALVRGALRETPRTASQMILWVLRDPLPLTYHWHRSRRNLAATGLSVCEHAASMGHRVTCLLPLTKLLEEPSYHRGD